MISSLHKLTHSTLTIKRLILPPATHPWVPEGRMYLTFELGKREDVCFPPKTVGSYYKYICEAGERQALFYFLMWTSPLTL